MIFDALTHKQEFLTIKTIDAVLSELRNNYYLYTARYTLVRMPPIFS